MSDRPDSWSGKSDFTAQFFLYYVIVFEEIRNITTDYFYRIIKDEYFTVEVFGQSFIR